MKLYKLQGMAILAMMSHGQDARATANDTTTQRLVVVSFGSGMAILAMMSHGQDARATANDTTTQRLYAYAFNGILCMFSES